MILIDVVLLIILAGFVFYGIFSGLIKMIGYLIGLLIGVFVASHYYQAAYQWLDWLFFGKENLGKVLCFIIILSIATKIISLVFGLLDEVIGLASILPFVKSINKLAGGIFGLLEGTLFLAAIIYVSSRYTLVDTFLAKQLMGSQIVPYLMKAVNLVTPFFPAALKLIKSVI